MFSKDTASNATFNRRVHRIILRDDEPIVNGIDRIYTMFDYDGIDKVTLMFYNLSRRLVEIVIKKSDIRRFTEKDRTRLIEQLKHCKRTGNICELMPYEETIAGSARLSDYTPPTKAPAVSPPPEYDRASEFDF